MGNVLGIGVHQQDKIVDQQRGNLKLLDIVSSPIKYYNRTSSSCGAFGLALSSSVYDILLRTFDYQTSGVCNDVAIDAMDLYKERGLLNDSMRSINIYPTLILPDVTNETLMGTDWIERNTLIGHKEHVSKYYSLREDTEQIVDYSHIPKQFMPKKEY